MQFSYVLIDGSQVIESTLESISVYDAFMCVAVCKSRTAGINKILELKPDLVLWTLVLAKHHQRKLLHFHYWVNCMSFRCLAYYNCIEHLQRPGFWILSTRGFGLFVASDWFQWVAQMLAALSKTHKALYADKISIKSNGDYHFITTQDIVYLKADNNTTDFICNPERWLQHSKHWNILSSCCRFISFEFTTVMSSMWIMLAVLI